MTRTPPLSALSSIKGMEGKSEAHMARDEEEKKKRCVSMRQRKTELVNRLAIRQSLLSHENTPPFPPTSKPVIQALSVKDTETDGPENLDSRLSQFSSCLIKSHTPHPPLLAFSSAECLTP